MLLLPPLNFLPLSFPSPLLIINLPLSPLPSPLYLPTTFSLSVFVTSSLLCQLQGEALLRNSQIMALEAVVFPPYACKDYFYSLVGAAPNFGFQAAEEEKLLLGIINTNIEHNLYANLDSSSTTILQNVKEQQWDSHSSPEACTIDESTIPPPSSSAEATATTTSRRKRRRTKSEKNKEEIENQRTTHIAVERNRRKQMNEYLAVLRSLMPSSYVQRVS